MAGTEPHGAGAKEQRRFEQTVVDQVVHAADEAQHHQATAVERQTGDEGAKSQQNNADIFEGVISQQALNIVLHQGVQSADKRGYHPHDQQQHAPPQRRRAPGKRDR